ncbi:S1-like domain-containing protein [Psidium guajava]|nr:S1-like domain-containing protein [Psidium guajava]
MSAPRWTGSSATWWPPPRFASDGRDGAPPGGGPHDRDHSLSPMVTGDWGSLCGGPSLGSRVKISVGERTEGSARQLIKNAALIRSEALLVLFCFFVISGGASTDHHIYR